MFSAFCFTSPQSRKFEGLYLPTPAPSMDFHVMGFILKLIPSYLRHPFTEKLPICRIGQNPNLPSSPMGGTDLPRGLMDHIGFGPGWAQWALGAHFWFWGAQGANFWQFWKPHAGFDIDGGPKIWIYTMKHSIRTICWWKKIWEFFVRFRTFWGLQVLPKCAKKSYWGSEFDQNLFALKNYSYVCIIWAIFQNVVFSDP